MIGYEESENEQGIVAVTIRKGFDRWNDGEKCGFSKEFIEEHRLVEKGAVSLREIPVEARKVKPEPKAVEKPSNKMVDSPAVKK